MDISTGGRCTIVAYKSRISEYPDPAPAARCFAAATSFVKYQKCARCVRASFEDLVDDETQLAYLNAVLAEGDAQTTLTAANSPLRRSSVTTLARPSHRIHRQIEIESFS
jgi:hypothetical protein